MSKLCIWWRDPVKWNLPSFLFFFFKSGPDCDGDALWHTFAHTFMVIPILVSKFMLREFQQFVSPIHKPTSQSSCQRPQPSKGNLENFLSVGTEWTHTHAAQVMFFILCLCNSLVLIVYNFFVSILSLQFYSSKSLVSILCFNSLFQFSLFLCSPILNTFFKQEAWSNSNNLQGSHFNSQKHMLWLSYRGRALYHATQSFKDSGVRLWPESRAQCPER